MKRITLFAVQSTLYFAVQNYYLTIARTKKRTLQSSMGGWPRPQTESRRQRFLYTDVTPAENEKIPQYCEENGISVSQFLADLMLRDALKAKTRSKQKIILRIELRIELELTPQQLDRLELLTRLHEKAPPRVLRSRARTARFERLYFPLQFKGCGADNAVNTVSFG